MFSSIYSATITPVQFFIMAGAAIITGLIYAWLMSFRIKSTKRFFVVVAVLPFIVGAVITFVNGSIGAGVAVGGAFGLIRFRSAPGSADEIGRPSRRTTGLLHGIRHCFRNGLCRIWRDHSSGTCAVVFASGIPWDI